MDRPEHYGKHWGKCLPPPDEMAASSFGYKVGKDTRRTLPEASGKREEEGATDIRGQEL